LDRFNVKVKRYFLIIEIILKNDFNGFQDATF